MGGNIRVWGCGELIPAAGDWQPRHDVLDRYKASLYVDCRSAAPRRFFAKEFGNIAVALYRIAMYCYYRADRWLYVHRRALIIAISCVLFPATALVVVSYT